MKIRLFENGEIFRRSSCNWWQDSSEIQRNPNQKFIMSLERRICENDWKVGSHWRLLLLKTNILFFRAEIKEEEEVEDEADEETDVKEKVKEEEDEDEDMEE